MIGVTKFLLLFTTQKSVNNRSILILIMRKYKCINEKKQRFKLLLSFQPKLSLNKFSFAHLLVLTSIYV